MFLGLMLGGYVWAILVSIMVLVDVAHKNQWSLWKFSAWLFGSAFLIPMAIALVYDFIHYMRW